MKTRSIQYFLAVVEEMNYTRAAQKLYISQQALSAHIQRLEEEYQVTLFERKPSLHLTEAGKQMAFYGRQILESERNLQRALSDISENCRGILRVGMSRLRGAIMFPLVYQAYHPTHPNISLELVSGNSEVLDKMLMEDKLDVYLGLDVPPSSFETQILITTEQLACVMTRSLLRQYYPDSWQQKVDIFRRSVCLDDLLDLPLITLRSGARIRDSIDRVAAGQRRPNYVLECDQVRVAYEMALAGVGAALVTPVTRYAGLDKSVKIEPDEVYFFPLADLQLQNSLYLVYRSDHSHPQHVIDFIELSSRVLKERCAAAQASSFSLDLE